jgi:hypothetical protein
MTITGAQANAARLLLGWDVQKVAAEAGLSHKTITSFEERRRVSTATIAEIRHVLEKAGVEFSDEGEPALKLGN